MEIDVVVCGDSFCASEKEPRVHFSQILADQYNVNLINLARAGCSNIAIAFQIEYAISLKPKTIIFNRTFPDRVEIIDRETETVSLNDFKYPYPLHDNYLSKHVGSPDSPIFSTVVQGLDNQPYVDLTPNQLQAVKLWVSHLFDWKLKQKTDGWVIDHLRNMIIDNHIQPIELRRDNFAKVIYDFRGAVTPFHTDEDTQVWLAEKLYNQLGEII